MTIHPPTQYANDANLRARQKLWESQEPRFDPIPWVLGLAGLNQASEAQVLDVGCGNGLYVHEMRRRGVNVVGTDLSSGMLSAVKHRELVQSDAQCLPFAADTFDVVLAPHMLYHVPDRVKAVTEFRRVLRPEGVCVVTTNGAMHMRSLRAVVEATVRTTDPDWSMVDPSTRYFTLDNGSVQLEQSFDSVTLVRPADIVPVRVTDVELAANYVASVGDFYGPEVSMPWTDVVAEVRKHLAASIATSGEFLVSADTGAFVCR